MKYLSQYKESQQTSLFDRLGVFFAFNSDQLKEGLVKIKASRALTEGEKITCMDSGIYCPTKNIDTFIKELATIEELAMAADIADNGVDGIIRRELGNYECQITGDISDAVDALSPYGITEEQVLAGYKSFYAACVENDWF